jgi:hypothetical protein
MKEGLIALPESITQAPETYLQNVRVNLRSAPQELQAAVNEVIIRKSASPRSNLNINF